MTEPAASGAASPHRELAVPGAVFAALAALAALLAGPAEVAARMALMPGQIVTLALMVLTGLGLRAARWQFLAHRLGISSTAPRGMLIYLAGLALPGAPSRRREMARLDWVQSDTGVPAREVVPLVLLNRSVDRAAALALLAAALLLGMSDALGLLAVSLLTVAVCLVAGRPRVLETLSRYRAHLARFFPGPTIRVRSVVVPLATYQTPSVLILGAALAGLALLADLAVLCSILTWLAGAPPLWLAAVIGLGASMAGRLAGLPGGIGGTEVAMAVMLLASGASPATAVAATLLHRAATFWGPALLGLCLLPVVANPSADPTD